MYKNSKIIFEDRRGLCNQYINIFRRVFKSAVFNIIECVDNCKQLMELRNVLKKVLIGDYIYIYALSVIGF